MPSLPIVLAHGIARFDILTKALEKKLNLPENKLTDQLEYFKGVKGHLESHGFTVFHPDVLFAGSVDKRAEQLRDRVNKVLTTSGSEKVHIIAHSMELLLIVGGALLANSQMQQFGVTAFGITAGIHLAVIILGDLIKSKNRWLNLAKTALIFAIVLLVGLGTLTLSAVFGVESAWNILTELKDWILTPAPFGFNLRTLFRFGVGILVLIAFIFTLSPEIKAAFKKRPTLSPPEPD